MSKSPEVEKENHERWVISYADLVTLLLGFFIIMYATAQQDVELFQQVAQSISRAFDVEVKQGAGDSSPIFDAGSGIAPGSAGINQELQRIREAVDVQAQLRGVAPDSVVVTGDEQHIVIRLADNLLFPSASARIREDALPLLDVVGTVIAGLPNEIRVEGHTDNVPVSTDLYPTNWELSSARATAVLRYLVEQTGVEAERAFAAGYGEFRPEASNLTPEGRALNRRADIVVLYPFARVPVEDAVSPLLGQE